MPTMPKSLKACLVALLLIGMTASPGRADRASRSVKAMRDGFAAECRRLSWVPQDLCTAIGGLEVSETRVAAYENSWVHRALGLQRGLDDDVPFLRELIPHTHNSFNSSAYPATLTQLDPNQLYSMRDQLRMDIRAIEMDVHTWLDRVVLCHGNEQDVGGTMVHVGCSVDRPLIDGLSELRGWLAEPANIDEIVLLYLENALDGDPVAHEKAAGDIARILGPLVYRPPTARPCAPMPMTISRASVRATGARVLIAGNCGPGAWGSWVHQRGPQWDETSIGTGDNYPDYPACLAERAAVGYATHLTRRYEDSTWIGEMTDGTGIGGTSDVTLTETRRMIRCGVNLPGFDQLHPDDPRLAALVWSWATNEPTAGGSCAAHGPDARFYARSCRDALPLACIDSARAWRIARACPRGTRGGVPANGFENEQLREAKAAAGVPWVRLAYGNVAGRGWVPG